MSRGYMSQGVYVLGGKCPGGKCPGGKCPGGICPWGKCPGGLCPRTMPDVTSVIIAYKTCTCYSVLSKSQAKSAFTCNVCQGL